MCPGSCEGKGLWGVATVVSSAYRDSLTHSADSKLQIFLNPPALRPSATMTSLPSLRLQPSATSSASHGRVPPPGTVQKLSHIKEPVGASPAARHPAACSLAFPAVPQPGASSRRPSLSPAGPASAHAREPWTGLSGPRAGLLQCLYAYLPPAFPPAFKPGATAKGRSCVFSTSYKALWKEVTTVEPSGGSERAANTHAPVARCPNS